MQSEYLGTHPAQITRHIRALNVARKKLDAWDRITMNPGRWPLPHESIDNLELSVRAYNVLMSHFRWGAPTVNPMIADITATLSWPALLKIRNCGLRTAAEIAAAVERCGLRLSMSVDKCPTCGQSITPQEYEQIRAENPSVPERHAANGVAPGGVSSVTGSPGQ